MSKSHLCGPLRVRIEQRRRCQRKCCSVATQLGFAPVELGRFDKGATPLHVLSGRLGGLRFRTWRSSADCSSYLKSMLFLKSSLASPTEIGDVVVKVGFVGARTFVS